MSDAPSDDIIERLASITRKAHALGVPDKINPLGTLSFLALPVIPSLRLTDQGLFDVEGFRFVPLQ